MKTHMLDKTFDSSTQAGKAGLCGAVWVSRYTEFWDEVDCKRCLKLKNKEEEIYKKRKIILDNIASKG